MRSEMKIIKSIYTLENAQSHGIVAPVEFESQGLAL